VENILYSCVYVNGANSPDGETPSIIYVTNEVNCVAVWNSEFETPNTIIEHFNNTNEAIEFAVDLGRQYKAARIKRCKQP
jgi:hypothetical protein